MGGASGSASATRPWQQVLKLLSGYLRMAENFVAKASLADAFNFGPQLEANHSVRELVEEALRHWPGTWIDQIDARAPHEASLLNLPGRSGEPCGHAHPVMGACSCAA
jgi:CDP-glucose 4,6-dehydratase